MFTPSCQCKQSGKGRRGVGHGANARPAVQVPEAQLVLAPEQGHAVGVIPPRFAVPSSETDGTFFRRLDSLRVACAHV